MHPNLGSWEIFNNNKKESYLSFGISLQKETPSYDDGVSFCFFQQTLKLHGQGVADAVEGVIDLLAKGGHNSNYDDGDESENDRVLNETLAFFFGSE